MGRLSTCPPAAFAVDVRDYAMMSNRCHVLSRVPSAALLLALARLLERGACCNCSCRPCRSGQRVAALAPGVQRVTELRFGTSADLAMLSVAARDLRGLAGEGGV